MKTVELHCKVDKKITVHEVLGIVPVKLLAPDDESELMVKATVCTDCGNIKQLDVTEEEMEYADKKYINCLLRHGLISEKEAKEVLDENGI